MPRLTNESEHFIKSTFFKFDKLINVDMEYIKHDCIHILNVVKSQVAKIYQDNVPRLLSEGVHVIESSNFSYQEVVVIKPENLYITHVMIKILQIPRGKVALTWNKMSHISQINQDFMNLIAMISILFPLRMQKKER